MKTISQAELAARLALLRTAFSDQMQPFLKVKNGRGGLSKKQVEDMLAGFQDGMRAIVSDLTRLGVFAIADNEAGAPAPSGEKETYTNDEVREIEHDFRDKLTVSENRRNTLVLQMRSLLDAFDADDWSKADISGELAANVQGLRITVGRGA